MAFTIRPYHPSDLYALYRICLLTGANGVDASDLFGDPELLGHYYAAPYAVLEPDICFVLTHDGTPCGYVLGTRDSATFAARCEQEWFPVLRTRYPLPAPDDSSEDAKLIRRMHVGIQRDSDFADYPAHLHIDLLPIAQGQGQGRQLIHTFLDQLRTLGVPAVHLGTGATNHRAVRFYDRVGFERLRENQWSVVFGMRL